MGKKIGNFSANKDLLSSYYVSVENDYSEMI